MKFNSTALALALTVLAGCEKQDNVADEVYKGVPTNGQTCKQFYKLPVNQVKCTNAESRH